MTHENASELYLHNKTIDPCYDKAAVIESDV